jgi:long-chain acyl-CoA synthetase
MNTPRRGDTVNKRWLASYPAGVPAEIDPDKYRSLVEVFDHSIARYGALPAFANLGTTLSYQQLEEHSRAFAAFLQNELRLDRGARLAIMMPNLLQYPVALFGALRAGLTVVNTNPLYTQRELEYQLQDSGATAILVLENFAHVLASCIERTSVRHVIVSKISDMLPLTQRLPINAAAKYLRGMPARP